MNGSHIRLQPLRLVLLPCGKQSHSRPMGPHEPPAKLVFLPFYTGILSGSLHFHTHPWVSLLCTPTTSVAGFFIRRDPSGQIGSHFLCVSPFCQSSSIYSFWSQKVFSRVREHFYRSQLVPPLLPLYVLFFWPFPPTSSFFPLLPTSSMCPSGLFSHWRSPSQGLVLV